MQKIVIGITFFALAFTPVFVSAQVFDPFGGIVTSIQPCDTGILAYVREPDGGIVPLMWIAGELPYLMHVAPHPGQWVLGMADITPPPMICWIGPYSYGAGWPIIFHGSSL